MREINQVDITNFSKNDWLLQRRKAIGGSDVAAIAGLSKWKSAMDVYLDKISTEEPMEIENVAMHWGTKLEPAIRDEYAERNGVEVIKPTSIFYDIEHPFMSANLDGIVRTADGEFGYEGKTANLRVKNEWEDEQVPIAYVFQVQHYMAITGFKKFDIACLIGGQDYIERTVPRDDELIREIVDLEANFWDMVQKRTPPNWDGSVSAGEVLKKLYPKATEGKTVSLAEAPEEVVEAFKNYLECKNLIDDNDAIINPIKKQQEINKQVIQAYMQDAELATMSLDGREYKVTYKTVNRKEHFVKASSFRQFKIKMEVLDNE